jgi:hypothetical protein
VPGAAEDVNILGETGAEFAERRAKANPRLHGYYQRCTAGWTVLNAQGMRPGAWHRSPASPAYRLSHYAPRPLPAGLDT